MLPEKIRSHSVASSASSDVWSRGSHSLPTQIWVQAPTTTTERRSSTTSAASQPAQNTWVSRSRTSQGETKPAARLKVQKIKSGRKKTEKTEQKQTKADKINAIVSKGKKAGQLSNGVWFKTPKDFKPIRQPTKRRSAVKKQKSVKNKTFTAVQEDSFALISPETRKTVRKLRKKVKQCTKIQEKLSKGMKLEVNEAEKLKQLDNFKQQLAVLELQISTATDDKGFELVKKRRR